jgi:hypothetical protein
MRGNAETREISWCGEASGSSRRSGTYFLLLLSLLLTAQKKQLCINGTSTMWNLYFMYRFGTYNYNPLQNIALDIVHILFQKGLVRKYLKMLYDPLGENILIANQNHWTLVAGVILLFI